VEVIEQFRLDHERVVHETIDGETILVQLETGNYYSLRGTAGETWKLLESGLSIDGAVAEIQSRYEDVDRTLIDGGVRALADELVRERLLEPCVPANGAAAASGSVALDPPAPTFAAPTLEKYTDMQGFLLLDPIHESDSTGWPHPKPEAT
jgi:hypothetical protein